MVLGNWVQDGEGIALACALAIGSCIGVPLRLVLVAGVDAAAIRVVGGRFGYI